MTIAPPQTKECSLMFISREDVPSHAMRGQVIVVIRPMSTAKHEIDRDVEVLGDDATRIVRAYGKESVTTSTGGRIVYRSMEPSSGRGMTVDAFALGAHATLSVQQVEDLAPALVPH